MRKILTLLVCAVIATCSFVFMGCAPTSTGDTCEKLLENGYEIEAYYIKPTEAEDELDIDIQLEAGAYVIDAYKDSGITERVIYIFVFEKSADAKKVFDEYKSDLEELLDDEGVVEKHGKSIVIATKSAYEDYKK